MTDGPDLISLNFNLPNKFIYIHNLYNPINAKKVNISIQILKHRLSAHLNREHIILKNFILYHKTWEELRTSKTLIEKSENLSIVISRWEIDQMVSISIAIYNKSIWKSTINLIFAILLFWKSLIYCNVANNFDYNLDY